MRDDTDTSKWDASEQYLLCIMDSEGRPRKHKELSLATMSDAQRTQAHLLNAALGGDSTVYHTYERIVRLPGVGVLQWLDSIGKYYYLDHTYPDNTT